ncbi:hypothetical protein ACFWRV_11245 [Streptomyces sp. NPDC058576]|uniref:hypothetical protein n=1 Tax=Streptomyces sp. NPDC058576 TaxID=3346547 RepID=UPI00364E1C6B
MPAPVRLSVSAPQEALARLGVTPVGPLGVRRAPSASTIRRALMLVCPGALADLLGRDPAGAKSLPVDGKIAWGSRTRTAAAAHLLSTVRPGGHAVAQLRVPGETTAFLAPFNLTGVAVTAAPCAPADTARSGW